LTVRFSQSRERHRGRQTRSEVAQSWVTCITLLIAPITTLYINISLSPNTYCVICRWSGISYTDDINKLRNCINLLYLQFNGVATKQSTSLLTALPSA
jgi:hypothetical protein